MPIAGHAASNERKRDNEHERAADLPEPDPPLPPPMPCGLGEVRERGSLPLPLAERPLRTDPRVRGASGPAPTRQVSKPSGSHSPLTASGKRQHNRASGLPRPMS